MVVKKQKNPPSSKNRAKTKDPPSSKKKKKKAIYPWAVQPELQQLILDVQPKLQQLIQDIRHVTVAVDWDARLPHSVLGTDSSPVPLQVPYSQDLVAFQSPARLEIQTSKLTAVATAVAPVASTTMPFSAAPMMVSSVSIISTGVDSIDTGTSTDFIFIVINSNDLEVHLYISTISTRFPHVDDSTNVDHKILIEC